MTKWVPAMSAALLALTLAAPPVADAATTYAYVASAGGTQVQAVGVTVSSDPTAQSTISGTTPRSTSGHVASAYVANLLSVGAVTTDASATNQGDGKAVRSHARTARVSLLNGAIRLDAIDTTATAEADSSTQPSGGVATQLLGLTISGKHYPIDVKPNTGIVIPGVASVVLNAQYVAVAHGAVAVIGAGLEVTLLKPRGNVAAGATILVNPVFLSIAPLTTSAAGPPVSGGAYGSYVNATVNGVAQVESGRTAPLIVPFAGTDAKTYTNSTARAYLAGVLNLGTIESQMTASTTPALTDVTTSNKVARVSLFGGLVSATAIGSTSHARLADGVSTLAGSLQFVHLRIAGKEIPIDVPPNTSLHIAKLGTLTLNEQKSIDVPGVMRGVQVTGLHLVLDTARAGLPVGAEVQLAVSQAIIYG
jgi:hypothetical protein